MASAGKAPSKSAYTLIHTRIRTAAETVRRVQGEAYDVGSIVIDDESREGMSDNRFKGHWEDRSIAILYDERPPPSYNQEADLNAEIYLGICNESLNMIRNLERYLST